MPSWPVIWVFVLPISYGLPSTYQLTGFFSITGETLPASSGPRAWHQCPRDSQLWVSGPCCHSPKFTAGLHDRLGQAAPADRMAWHDELCAVPVRVMEARLSPQASCCNQEKAGSCLGTGRAPWPPDRVTVPQSGHIVRATLSPRLTLCSHPPPGKKAYQPEAQEPRALMTPRAAS